MDIINNKINKYRNNTFLKILFIIILILIPIWGPMISYLLLGYKDHIISIYTDKLGFLFVISLYLQIIFIFILRYEIKKIFLDEKIPYPQSFKDKISTYLNLVFSPHLNKNESYPEDFRIILFKKIKIKYFDFKYVALILGIFVGIVSFFISYYDEMKTSFLETLIGAGFGVFTTWLITLSMSWMIIGVFLILKQLYHDFESAIKGNEMKITSVTIKKLEKIRIIPIMILFGYSSFMIAFPSIFILSFEGISAIFGSIINITVGLIGFIIVLVVPSMYVYKILDMLKKKVKDDYDKQIEKIEIKINSNKIEENDLKIIDFLNKQSDKIDKVHLLPTDSFSVIRIVISAIIGNFYYVFIIFKNVLEMKR